MPNQVEESPWQPQGDGVAVRVLIQPRASRNEVCGIHDGALKIRITAPPVDGAANECCCTLLARLLNIPKSAVQVRSGQTSRRKCITITGVTLLDLERLLA